MPSLFADLPEWSDITPIPQYAGDVTPLAPIFYTDEYRDATDYFRGIVKVGEKSERALELTERIIRMNPAHYSAWQYRYKIILTIGWPLDLERELMDELAVKYLKNYQVWHHRRLLLTALKAQLEAVNPSSSAPSPTLMKVDVDPESTPVRAAAQYELDFIARGLKEDTKNYHTWAYRQFILAFFGDEELWKGELPWVEELLREDVRNNSAWHHRFFVVFASGVRKGDEDREAVLKRELQYGKDAIALAPNNPSAWNYVRGILDHTGTPYSELRVFVEPYTADHVQEDEIEDLDNPRPGTGAELPCPTAIEFLAEVLEKEGENGVHQAVQLYKLLAGQYDTIRKKYWEHRIKEALQRA